MRDNTRNDATSNAVEILDLEFGDDPAYQDLRAQERVKSQAAHAIYEARTAAGLTQSELARRAGTTQSVISRLEDADYDRHSLALLERFWSASPRPCIVRSRCACSRRTMTLLPARLNGETTSPGAMVVC